MELKELLREDEGRLFNEFASMPTVSHALDRRRFVRYAIVSNYNCSGFNDERVRVLCDKGLREREINELRMVYEWLDEVLEVLK